MIDIFTALVKAAAAVVTVPVAVVADAVTLGGSLTDTRFLVHYSERMKTSGQSSERLLLRMCRRDIASHLGVAHETVSRSFSALVELGFLRVNNRAVDILDLERLRLLSTSTRSVLDDKPRRSSSAQNQSLNGQANRQPSGKNGPKSNGHPVNGSAGDAAAAGHSSAPFAGVGIDVFSVFAARERSAQASALGGRRISAADPAAQS